MLNINKVLELAIDGANNENKNNYQSIIDLCKKEMFEHAAKSKGSAESTRYKVALKLINDTKQQQEFLNGVWMEEEYQCICNGYIGIMLENHIDNLPKVPDDITKMNLSKLFSFDERDMEEVEIPNIQELKNGVKIASMEYKAKTNTKKTPESRQIMYLEGGSYTHKEWHCDPLLLTKAIEILGGNNIKLFIPDRHIAPAYLTSDNGKALILPMNHKKEEGK